MDAYEELKFIGRGNYGSAHLVTEKATGEKMVMKKIAIFDMEDDERANAMQEVRLLKSLGHPSIVKYIDSFVDGSTLGIVMRYCEGGDLAAHIKRASKAGNKYFDEEQIIDWFIQLISAIAYIHSRRILHRDLKSSNVFLTKNNLVKLGDFGIARVLDYTMDHAKTVVGTPYYMSPEVCENLPYSFKSDMWALGCILYEMCTLRHAFDASNLLGLVYKIVQETQPPIPDHYSSDLKHLVACMLAKDPTARLSPAQVFALPFIRKRMEGMASSGGTLGKRVVRLNPREARERRRQEAVARREEELRRARVAAHEDALRAKERAARMFRPTAEAHSSLTSGDTRELSKTVDPAPGSRAGDTSPRSPPPRPRTVASSAPRSPSYHPSDGGGRRRGDSKSAWEDDDDNDLSRYMAHHRPVPSPSLPNPADERPITASGHYAFESGSSRPADASNRRGSAGSAASAGSGAGAGAGAGAARGSRPRPSGSAGSRGSRASPGTSPVLPTRRSTPSTSPRPTTRAGAGSAREGGGAGAGRAAVAAMGTPPRHPPATSVSPRYTVASAGDGSDDSDGYSDDFEEEEDDSEYTSKAQDQYDKNLFMRILRSHIVDPDGAKPAGSRDVATPAPRVESLEGTLGGDAVAAAAAAVMTGVEDLDAFTASKLPEFNDDDDDDDPDAAFDTRVAIQAPRPRDRGQRVRVLREEMEAELGKELFTQVYEYLKAKHEEAKVAAVDPRAMQARLARFVNGNKRQLARLQVVDQLVYEEELLTEADR